MTRFVPEGQFKVNVWQARSARPETIWTWISLAFGAYWVLFVLGAFLDMKALNAVGGVIVLAALAWLLLERLWVGLDAVVFASMASAFCIPLLQVFGSSMPAGGALFKHVSLCLVIAASRLLKLPTASQSKMRGILAFQVLAILIVSTTIYRGTSWDGGTRHSGLFVNPNNLALIPFLLLFFINPARDGKLLRLTIHGVVVAVLAYSGTNGAIMAYGIGLAVRARTFIPGKYRSAAYAILAATGATVIIFVAAGGDRMLPETRLTNQLSVMRSQYQTVLAGGDIAYYEQEKVLGPGSGSAIWRLSHWRRTLVTYSDGTLMQQLVGFGLGSSPQILGKLPHNEYLRMLFEQGLLGFALFLFTWSKLIRTADPQVQYVGIIVAIYSFSENNLDNFPFMALFVLCLSARDIKQTVRTAVRRLPTSVRRSSIQPVQMFPHLSAISVD